MKPLQLSFLRKSIYQTTRSTDIKTINKIVESIYNGNYPKNEKYELAQLLNQKNSNLASLTCLLRLANELNDTTIPYTVYESTKNELSLDKLKEFALFANHVNDPFYQYSICEFAKSSILDPIEIKSKTKIPFKSILISKSILVGFLATYYPLLSLSLLTINGIVLYKLMDKANISKLQQIENDLFFTPLALWTKESIDLYFGELHDINKSL